MASYKIEYDHDAYGWNVYLYRFHFFNADEFIKSSRGIISDKLHDEVVEDFKTNMQKS